MSLDGASGAWFKTATLSFSSPSVCWSVLATYIWVEEYQDLLLDAFSNAAALTVVPCFVAGHFGLCCFLLMIKAMYTFYKKLLLCPPRGFREERLLIQWYVNSVAAAVAAIWQVLSVSQVLLEIWGFPDGVHIRPHALAVASLDNAGVWIHPLFPPGWWPMRCSPVISSSKRMRSTLAKDTFHIVGPCPNGSHCIRERPTVCTLDPLPGPFA